jgi:uncharacterized membrane protein
MFEFLFKYPVTVFSRGTFVLLGGWPVWLLFALILAVAAGLGSIVWLRRKRISASVHGMRTVAVWLLQTALLALVLVLLWQPAMSIPTLKPQQNIVAVVVDDSRSMSTQEDGSTRIQKAVQILNNGLIKNLQDKFQVRVYRLGDHLERVPNTAALNASSPATHIGMGLKDLLADSATLPVGAIVLLSDGGDNSGGIDLETISEIKRQHIPVHTIGFGRERFERDVELSEVQVPNRALPQSRVQAQVTIRQRGYNGQRAHLVARENGAVVASQQVLLNRDTQIVPVLLNAGAAGVKNVEFSIDLLSGEENTENNRQTRVINVDPAKRRILYVEGEPRWDFKFMRRALDDEKNIELVTMLRTTQNKIYRQGISGEAELKEGFPSKVEELFDYQAIILGSVEANYFTPTQQEMIHQFVDRRGGGLLFMGGRASLSDGGYTKAPFADMLPVKLPDRHDTFHRDPAQPELAPAGRDSLICRLDEDPDKNVKKWKELPYLMNYQESGTPKPGALLLAEMTAGGRKMPLLVTQNYGRGRTAVFATGGDWRWKMLLPHADMTHATFWRQFMSWLVNDTPTRVVASTHQPILSDDGHLKLRAEVRDTTYLPASDAQVEAKILGPGGASQVVAFRPDPLEQGVYSAEWNAEQSGSYVAEVSAKRGQQDLGRHVVTFRRENGTAENFHREQNRDLLEKLASQTGGRYYRPDDAARLNHEITYSEAGITVRETKDLWDMPAVFFLALILRASEWLLRRKWGVV